MGNGSSSSRRNGRTQSSTLGPPLPPRMVPPPPGYPSNHAPYPGPPLYPSNGHHAPYFYPPNYGGGGGGMAGPLIPQLSPPGYMPHTNGQYMMDLQQGFRPMALNPPPPPATPPVAETQNANTIRNDVNLKKATLRLEKDEENPGFHVVAFTFDANLPGSISIFFLAKEEEQCGFKPLKPQLYKVRRVPFEKGYVQKFQQAAGSGVNLAMFDERDLFKEKDKHVYPLVIRMETLGKEPPPDFSIHDEVPIDQAVPKWVNCQTTQAVIEKKEDGTYKARIIRQTVWVDGEQYQIEEIYGIEHTGGAAGFDGNDAGKECVICMSEPRDTTVLPCRHMCMCSECAKVLRFQTNRCPICRTPVEKLLEIKVPKMDNIDAMTTFDTHDTNASQSSAHSHVGQSSGSPHRSARKEDSQNVKG